MDTRLAVLNYWRRTAQSTRRSYRAKARWIVLATFMFTIALVWLCLMGIALVGA